MKMSVVPAASERGGCRNEKEGGKKRKRAFLEVEWRKKGRGGRIMTLGRSMMVASKAL